MNRLSEKTISILVKTGVVIGWTSLMGFSLMVRPQPSIYEPVPPSVPDPFLEVNKKLGDGFWILYR